MAIKPKSRAHENRLKSLESLAPFFQNHIKALREDWAAHDERIKALEKELAFVDSELQTLKQEVERHFFAHREIKRVCYARKWWQVWR